MSTQSTRFMDFLPFVIGWERKAAGQYSDAQLVEHGDLFRAFQMAGLRTDTRTAAALLNAKWIETGCEQLPSPLAEAYFDTVLDWGLGKAQRMLEAAGGKRGQAEVLCNLREEAIHKLSIAHRSCLVPMSLCLERVKALREHLGLLSY